MKIGLILLSGLMCILLFSGCCVSRVGEKTWHVGVVDYYADFSDIKEQTVYEKDGEFFIFVKEVGYKPEPGWVAVLTPPLEFWSGEQIPVESRNQYVLLKISPEAKEYLCSEVPENDQENEVGFYNTFNWDLQQKRVPEMEVISKFDMGSMPKSDKEIIAPSWGRLPNGGVYHLHIKIPTHQIVKKVPAPEVICLGGPMGGAGAFVHNSRKLYRERSILGYFLTPVAVVGYVVDVPASVLTTAYLYCIYLPFGRE